MYKFLYFANLNELELFILFDERGYFGGLVPEGVLQAKVILCSDQGNGRLFAGWGLGSRLR